MMEARNSKWEYDQRENGLGNERNEKKKGTKSGNDARETNGKRQANSPVLPTPVVCLSVSFIRSCLQHRKKDLLSFCIIL